MRVIGFSVAGFGSPPQIYYLSGLAILSQQVVPKPRLVSNLGWYAPPWSPSFLEEPILNSTACFVIGPFWEYSAISERRLMRLTFWDTLWEQFCLSDQSALIDASLWRKPLYNLCKSSSTQPKTQPSKPLWERNGLNISAMISRFKLFRSFSYNWRWYLQKRDAVDNLAIASP